MQASKPVVRRLQLLEIRLQQTRRIFHYSTDGTSTSSSPTSSSGCMASKPLEVSRFLFGGNNNNVVPPPPPPFASHATIRAIDGNANFSSSGGGSSRSFHATSTAPCAERKRRRRRVGGGAGPADNGNGDDDDDASTTKGTTGTHREHSPVTDPEEFREAGQAILEKLQTAVQPMIAINDPFKVNRRGDVLTIEVDPANGSYVVDIDAEERILVFKSPVSGSHSYFFSKKTHEWIDTVDHHSFVGMFVRDLIRICQGVPKI